MTFGQLPYDVAHLLGGAMLLLSFVLLYQRRVRGGDQRASRCRARCWPRRPPGRAGAGRAAALPDGADRLRRQGGADPAGAARCWSGGSTCTARWRPRSASAPSLIAGVALVALAILVVLPVTAAARRPLAREDLALALSVVLLGHADDDHAAQRDQQVIGLMSLENGLILAAVGVAGMPLVVELSTAALVLVVVVVAGVVVFQIRERLRHARHRLPGPARGATR